MKQNFLSCRKDYYILTILTVFAFGAGLLAFPLSYLSPTNVLIGLALFPFVLFASGARRFNFLFFLLFLAFGILSTFYQVKMFFFLCICFYLLLVFESALGRTNTLVFFLVVVMSPAFLQIAVIFGFPIRLYISEWAGAILQVAGFDIFVEGNVIFLDGAAFAVDEACMGLNMLAISVLMGIFVIAYHYHLENRKLSFSYLFLFFAVVFLLNIISNLFRIVMLVIFRIPANDVLHEMTGILCLMLYVMTPLYFIGAWLVRKYGVVFLPANSSVLPRSRMTGFFLVLAIGLVGLGLKLKNSGNGATVDHATVSFTGAKAERLAGGITKFYDGELLIYVKPIAEFFTAEHTPLICWKGSGYKFKAINKTSSGNHEFYTGILDKDGEQLYTAWWYSDGTIETVDQLRWRMRMLKGDGKFCLVNVTAPDRQKLIDGIDRILHTDLFKIKQ
jgi:exosortase N